MRRFCMIYSGLNLNQDKAMKPQTVQIVRQGEATPYWFKFNPLYLLLKTVYPPQLPIERFRSVSARSR